jgi:hypothetical protein
VSRVGLLSLVVGGLALVQACQPLPPPSQTPPLSPRWRGLELVPSQCVSSDVERCFDARDDDCDGYIDEGCGMGTGPLQLVLAWDDSDLDLDLEVRDPQGELAPLGGVSGSGLTRERDCPSEASLCAGQNVETVYLVGGEPERGTYVVRVGRRGAADTDAQFTVGLRVQGATYSARPRVGPRQELRFELLL